MWCWRHHGDCPGGARRFEHARDIAAAWGADFYDIGEAGHVNDKAGFGPWPEGTLMFGRFVSGLR